MPRQAPPTRLVMHAVHRGCDCDHPCDFLDGGSGRSRDRRTRRAYIEEARQQYLSNMPSHAEVRADGHAQYIYILSWS